MTLPAALLPLVALALASGCHALSCRVLPAPRAAADRVCATAVLGPAGVLALVLSLGAAHSLAQGSMAAAAFALASALALASGGPARALVQRDARAAASVLRATFFGGPHALAAWAGLAAMLLAAWATWLTSPWAWDALGYHLPIVHDALQTRGLREVPTNIVYVNVYPRAVDLFFVGWRLLLPDDTWIELAQLPFALGGVAGLAGLARRAGASAPRSLALGLLFLTVPVVALELATNYVDVAYASLLVLAVYFATGPLERADVALGGLALGLFLASKPSAPVATCFVLAAVTVRALRRRVPLRALPFALLALALGAKQYVVNMVAHGNPLWPVQLRAGPLTLPGLQEAAHFFNSGVPQPYRHYGWLGRLLGSWFAAPRQYIYDMRIGGYGPLFALCLLPLAVFALARRPSRAILVPVALLSLCALATPGAFWARYTLALPGALLALAAVATEPLSPRARSAIDLTLALAAAWGLALAAPGFTESGPSLLALSGMSASERAARVSVDGHEREWAAARALMGEGEAFGYDRSFGLPGQLWRPDGRGRVAYFSGGALAGWLRTERVRVAALGEQGAALAAGRPGLLVALFRCPLDTCTVYRVAGEP